MKNPTSTDSVIPLSFGDSVKSLIPITVRPEIVFTRGEGSWLIDSQGKRYLDFVQGWAVNTLGHSHPAIVEAIQNQAELLINPSPAFYNHPMLDLADGLVAACELDQVFFANSGAEANEGAIKLARKWGSKHKPLGENKQGAWKIISFKDGFHGRTLTTMAASGKAGWDDLFAPKTPGFTKVTYNDLAAVEQAIDDETVAIMLEPIQGEAGVIPATAEFLQGLRKLADEHQLLLIIDEVQTGMGRTGKMFCHQQAGVVPDVMTLGKGIGGGVPLSALMCKASVSCFEPGDQGGTYNGNPLMCAVGLAVLNELQSDEFLQQVQENGRYLWEQLEELSGQYDLGQVRGQGLLLALETGAVNATELAAIARDAGLLINAPRPNALRFIPALNVSKEEIDQMIVMLDKLLAEMTGN